ncbi:DUF6445 family protein [Sphingomonadaceae bacterium OTU29MARTA1]|nr:DUF6445 family protein [Sphingomonadaceae bacterium OTU29MARTA1]
MPIVTPHTDQDRRWFAEPGAMRLLHVGEEGEPVVVIDGASGIPDALVDAAANTSFTEAARAGSGYPGLLGPAPVAYIDAMIRFVLPLIAAHFTAVPVVPARARGNFSLVTIPPEALSPDQCVPHVDTVDRLQFATVHFLSPDDADGTGFFRHSATGYETIDADRLPSYRAALDREMIDHPPSGYRTGSDAQFERIGAVEARYDRLVLYRAALLHSGLVSHLPVTAADPRRGRLTGNLFLQCKAMS